MRLERDEDIRRGGVEWWFQRGVAVHEAREDPVAEVFEQKEAIRVVFGKDRGRLEVDRGKVSGDGGEGRGVVALSGGGVHQDGRPGA